MGWFRSSDDADEERARTLEDRLASITPGVPGRCPACDGLGYIDSIDIAHRYQIQHCKDCQHRWEYLFDQHGAVVGLTELDDAGQPTARTRVRPLRATPPAPAPELDLTAALPAEADESVAEPDAPADIELTGEIVSIDAAADDDGVLDLREPVVEPVVEPAVASADHMSPAEWLRHSLRR